MTYGEMKDLVLQLLNQYSVAGEQVPLSYNGQQDLVARIPALTRDGLYYVTTTARRLRDVAVLAQPKELRGMLVYDLPKNCFQVAGGLLRIKPDGSVSRCRDYLVLGGRQLLLPKNLEGRWLVEYFRYPSVPTGVPANDAELDCPPEAQTAVAYYVAAHLAMEDDQYLHGALYNEFEMKMARLQEGTVLECGVTEDVFAYG